MDAQQVAAIVGTGVAAFASAFVSSWVALIRPMKRELESMQTGVRDSSSLGDRMTKLETRLEELDRRERQSEGKIEKIRDDLPKYVTTDEFATYASSTTKSLNALTEKVGRVIGMLVARRDRD